VNGLVHEVGRLSWEGCSFVIVVPKVGKWIEEKPKREACVQVVNVHHPHTKAQPTYLSNLCEFSNTCQEASRKLWPWLHFLGV